MLDRLIKRNIWTQSKDGVNESNNCSSFCSWKSWETAMILIALMQPQFSNQAASQPYRRSFALKFVPLGGRSWILQEEKRKKTSNMFRMKKETKQPKFRWHYLRRPQKGNDRKIREKLRFSMAGCHKTFLFFLSAVEKQISSNHKQSCRSHSPIVGVGKLSHVVHSGNLERAFGDNRVWYSSTISSCWLIGYQHLGSAIFK